MYVAVVSWMPGSMLTLSSIDERVAADRQPDRLVELVGLADEAQQEGHRLGVVTHEQVGGGVAEGGVGVDTHAGVPAVQRLLAEPHGQGHGQRDRRGEEAQLDLGRGALLGRQRLVEVDE